MTQHPRVDELVQHTDGQLTDVFGAKVIQNQQVCFLAGIQPGVIVVPVKMFPSKLGGQGGRTCVKHVKAAVKDRVGDGQCQVGLAQAGTADKH